jgi:hypothetical protein
VLHDPAYFANIRESMISSIATEAKSHDGGVIVNAATTLGGNLDRLKVLSPNERNLLHEWLNRILASPGNVSTATAHDENKSRSK